jgi:hypothetical protein
MNAKKIELVRQMLAKAESTTPEEAEALTEAAMKIMTRLGIDQAMLDASKPSDQREDIVCRIVYMNGIYARALVQMATYVSQGFGTTRLLVTQDVRIPRSADPALAGKMADKLWVYGFESDADALATLLESLKLQVMTAVRAHFRSLPEYERRYMTEMEAYKVRREFIMGFGAGVKRKIVEGRRTVVKEQGFKGTDLVLADRGNIVRSWVDENQNSRPLRGGMSAGSGYGGFSEGVAAGRNASLTTQRSLPKEK